MISNSIYRSKTVLLSLLMMLSLSVGQVMAGTPGNVPTTDDATAVVDRATGVVVAVETGGTVTIQAKNGQLIRVKMPANAAELKPGDHVTYALAWINGEAIASGVKLDGPNNPMPLEDGEGDEEEPSCDCSTKKHLSVGATNAYCTKKQRLIDARAKVAALEQKDKDLVAALKSAEDAYHLAEAAGAGDDVLGPLGIAIIAVQIEIALNLGKLADANDELHVAIQEEAAAKANAITLHGEWKQCCEGETADTCPGCPESADPLACP